MSQSFLDTIISVTRERIRAQGLDASRMESIAERVGSVAKSRRFRKALERSDRRNIIAEIKKASPSKGVINAAADVAATARSYQRNGAAAISVLTEPTFFMGSIDDLITVRDAVDIPVLRKDFIIDEGQILEAVDAGADGERPRQHPGG